MSLYLVALLPILFQFISPIPNISLGEFLFMPFILIKLKDVFLQKKIDIPKDLVLFYFVPIICCCFSLFSTEYFDIQNAFTVILRIIYYFLLIVVMKKEQPNTKFFKFYVATCIICSLYLYSQVMLHYFVGYDLPILLEHSSILLGSKTLHEVEEYYLNFGFRPASIFIEPSYYADYIVVSLLLLLFAPNLIGLPNSIFYRNNIKIAIILTFSLFLSTSNMGIAYSIIIWFAYIYKQKNAFFSIILSCIGICLLLTLFNSDLFAHTVNRLLSGGSLGPRLLRGLIIYDKLSLTEKLVGIGLNNIGNYVNHYSIFTIFDESDLNYTVTSTNRLLTCGIVGFASLIGFLMLRFHIYNKYILRLFTVIMSMNFLLANGEYTASFAFFYLFFYYLYITLENVGSSN